MRGNVSRLAGPIFILCLLASLCSVAATAAGRNADAARVLAIHMSPQGNATRFAMDLSGAVPFHVAVKANPDRVELDFPALAWGTDVPASGTGSGFVTVYRRATSPEGGTRVVLETTGPVRVATAGSGLAAPGQKTSFELQIVSEDGSPPPASVPAPLTAARPPVAASIGRLQAPARPAQVASSLPIPRPLAAAPANGIVPTSLLPSPRPNRTAPPAFVQPASLVAASVPLPVPLAPPFPRKSAGAHHIIAIDPGHGGIDPGTSSADGVFEKQITLEEGLVLKSALEASGRYTVIMTRSEDRFIPLQDRVRIAREAKAELFISLHCDAMEGRDARGATVYTLSQNASDAVSARIAANENNADALGGVDLSAQADGVADILIDLSMRSSMNESNRFAEILVHQFGDGQIRLQENIPHRSAGFAVLKAPDMPSVLIEMGYLSSPADAELLTNPAHQKVLAATITEGVDRFFHWSETGHKS